MDETQWLVKIKYGANDQYESVMTVAETEKHARMVASHLNARYQTAEYYVEEFDPAKLEGWTDAEQM